MLTVQNQLQQLFVQRPPCQNTNFTAFYPTITFTGDTRNHFETPNTKYPSDRFVLGTGGGTNTLQ